MHALHNITSYLSFEAPALPYVCSRASWDGQAEWHLGLYDFAQLIPFRLITTKFWKYCQCFAWIVATTLSQSNFVCCTRALGTWSGGLHVVAATRPHDVQHQCCPSFLRQRFRLKATDTSLATPHSTRMCFDCKLARRESNPRFKAEIICIVIFAHALFEMHRLLFMKDICMNKFCFKGYRNYAHAKKVCICPYKPWGILLLNRNPIWK